MNLVWVGLGCLAWLGLDGLVWVGWLVGPVIDPVPVAQWLWVFKLAFVEVHENKTWE